MATTSAPHHANAEYTVEAARADLAAAHRLAVRDDLHEGTWNHLSLTVPGKPDEILITPKQRHWSRIRASDLAQLGPDVDGAALEQANEHLWVGYRIHYPLHQARPDAACVLHAHPPYTTALTMVEGGVVEIAEQNALEFHEGIAYNDEYDAGRPVGLDQGEAMAAALGDKAFVLMLKNHGVVVTGPTVGIAYTRLYMLERYCRNQAIAMGYGRPLALIPEHHRQAASQGYMEDHFAAMKEILDEEEPDYAV
jgi:ribulose-5-phosphate 4-epimerase/fuculose-1-phosphate aldolase